MMTATNDPRQSTPAPLRNDRLSFLCSADVILRKFKLEMPKAHVRRTEKASWSSDSLDKAIQLIDGGSSIRNATKVMGIHFSSLQNRIKKGSTLGP
ncbi:hypothetical protein WA026_022652 [Henosepilachna vigintioctopunctata]|uniref:HTH psq-type domain-containing protein n=1 Tax=Henosepilachna vigintioctopunctata TaxID=420089 RepID=A0AAW1UEL6_9CUCU